MKQKQELIKREFSVAVPHLKGGNIIWTSGKGNIIGGKQDYKAIGIQGFDYTFFEEQEGRCVRKGLYGCLYFNHLIELWPWYWGEKLGKTINWFVRRINIKGILEDTGYQDMF